MNLLFTFLSDISQFMCKPNAEPSLLELCCGAAIKLVNRNFAVYSSEQTKYQHYIIN
jgi:hypothetical protein